MIESESVGEEGEWKERWMGFLINMGAHGERCTTVLGGGSTRAGEREWVAGAPGKQQQEQQKQQEQQHEERGTSSVVA